MTLYPTHQASGISRTRGTHNDAQFPIPALRARARLFITIVALISLIMMPSTALAFTTDPAEAAAGWLADQLVDGQRLVGSWTDNDGNVNEFDDHGGTADVVFALAAAGVGASHLAAAVDWLISESAMYTGEAFGSMSAGATAKLALAVMADGRDPRAVGNDLISALQTLEVADGTHAGRFSDAGDDDWSSTISQALAVLALERADGVAPSRQAIDYLLAQQCDDGGYPFSFVDNGCGQAIEIDGDSAIDATLIIIQALVAVGQDTSDAVAWIEAQFGTDGPTNSNTAGLAAVAFTMAGHAAGADRARETILALQDGCDGEATGAIAYNEADEGDAVFATRQAILGIADDGAYLTVSSAGASDSTPALDCDASSSVPMITIATAVVLLLAAGGIVAMMRRRGRDTDVVS